MKRARVTHPGDPIHARVRLPSSKSISNRALIIRALCAERITLHELSTADDTQLMQAALQSSAPVIDVKNAGTCMRFLTAFFAAREGRTVVLQGDERMQQRPIGILVDALHQLGAEIEYINHEGFPPLRITGKKLRGGKLRIDASVSSQYITALMLVAPYFANGLTIELQGAVSSLPYIHMTAELMQQFGANVSVNSSVIRIGNTHYQQNDHTISPDWSAASYWYEIAALSSSCSVLLEGLSEKSLQGDAVIAAYMQHFGVQTTYTNEGAWLAKTSASAHDVSFDLSGTPDLAPALAATAAATNISATLTGLQNLRIKESDRLAALETELQENGFDVWVKKDALQLLAREHFHAAPAFSFRTYGDHRLAMAFAPLCLCGSETLIEDPDVVNKSYPHFWNDLAQAGFRIGEVK